LEDGSDLLGGIGLLGLISNNLRGHNLGDIEVIEGITAQGESQNVGLVSFSFSFFLDGTSSLRWLNDQWNTIEIMREIAI
jgi:hypothetical protein